MPDGSKGVKYKLKPDRFSIGSLRQDSSDSFAPQPPRVTKNLSGLEKDGVTESGIPCGGRARFIRRVRLIRLVNFFLSPSRIRFDNLKMY
ncbi:MAG: hypothetical protein IPM31_13255 [Anaerolineae bacterium]|nr:hypothetical protein [Anaerolineae bacterium]MBL8106126.1 hypothetical protein [Anaerolineales bacterium]MCC7189279.1 hypothetical protein [Anaerolineales bacterium]